jgi:hypothetical protein
VSQKRGDFSDFASENASVCPEMSHLPPHPPLLRERVDRKKVDRWKTNSGHSIGTANQSVAGQFAHLQTPRRARIAD